MMTYENIQNKHREYLFWIYENTAFVTNVHIIHFLLYRTTNLMILLPKVYL